MRRSRTHQIASDSKPIEIKPTHEAIIKYINTYQSLTVEQVAKLLDRTEKHVRDVMRELVAGGYLQKVHAYRNSQSGSTPGVFYLATQGIRFLEEQDIDVREHRARLSQNEKRKPVPSLHTLAVNDFIIEAKLLELDYPDIHLVEVRYEWEYRQSPILLTPLRIRNDTLREEAIRLKPDTWLYFRLGKTRERACFFLEVDLDTDNPKQMKRKIAAYRDLFKKYWDEGEKRYISQYERLFGFDVGAVGFPTTSDHNRDTLRELARNELKATKEPGWLCELFLFAAIPHQSDPKTGRELAALRVEGKYVYLYRIWYTPFGKEPQEPVSLLGE